MIIITNKESRISASPVNAGDGYGLATALMPTGRLVLQQSAGGAGGGKTSVANTDGPADTLKSRI